MNEQNPENKNDGEGTAALQRTGQQQIEVRHGVDKNPTFSNSVNIHVANDAVMLQFLYIRPGANQATLLDEIVLSPQHAIKLQGALDNTIKQHFTKHIS